PLLIVTEAEGALDQGSMINFRVVDGRVRFEVALDTLEEAGLKVSSRMLGVALHVRTASSR
ncbi:MAG: YfiR family protein, partial [Proteobacteria bacterium]